MNITRTIVLATTQVVVSMGIASAANALIAKVKPDWVSVTLSDDKVDMIIGVAKVLGTTIAVAVFAAVVAQAAAEQVDKQFWSDLTNQEG